MLKRALAFLAITWLCACSAGRDLDAPPMDLDDFTLGHNIVVAPKVVKGPVSREVPVDQLTEAVKSAIAARFDRYQGTRRYHFGLSIEGYVLAQPGVPLVLSPKSVMVVQLTVWDDEKGGKLNAEPKVFTVLETFSAETVVGSGLTQTAEVQLANLAANVASAIEHYLVQQNATEGWFKGADFVPPRRTLAALATN
jgi:hypothetical protein